MITKGAIDITSQPSRIDGREQLPLSAADASGAVRLVTSCCVARPLDEGTTLQKQQFVKTGYREPKFCLNVFCADFTRRLKICTCELLSMFGVRVLTCEKLNITYNEKV